MLPCIARGAGCSFRGVWYRDVREHEDMDVRSRNEQPAPRAIQGTHYRLHHLAAAPLAIFFPISHKINICHFAATNPTPTILPAIHESVVQSRDLTSLPSLLLNDIRLN